MFVKVIGFAPDVDPSTPGVITDCDSLIPSIKGMRALASEVDAGIADLSATAQGTEQIVLLDGTVRTFAGTVSKIYEIGTTTWIDRTRASSAYSIGAENRWDFAQFGNVTLAAGNTEPLQYSDTSGAFDDISGAPQCKLVETVGDFAMVFDTDDSPTSTSFGDQPDRWWCSGIGDYTDWTPSIATQCATGRLTETPGQIVGARRLGDYIVAYKERSMYLGVYQGPPLVWSWQLVPVEIGALSNEAIISVDAFHLFISFEDFFSFDGTRPVSIGANTVREWFFENLNENYKYRIIGVHDRRNFLAVWYFPSTTGGGSIDSFIAYNYRSRRWGYGKKTITAALEYSVSGPTYDGIGSLYSTYDDLPSQVTYDSPFWVAQTPYQAIINSSGRLKTLSGAASSSVLVTGDIGDDGVKSVLTRVRPRFITVPTTGMQEHRWRDQAGGTESTATTTTLTQGVFDSVLEARWHRLRHDYTGDMELVGFDLETQPGSYE